MIPLPVIASVVRAKMKPIMAALPFNCSENAVKPWGIFSFLSAIMEMDAVRRGATTACVLLEVNEVVKEGVVRASTGTAETNAVEFIVRVLRS